MITMISLPEAFDLRLRVQELELRKADSRISLFERCDLEDQILEIKEKLGQFDRQKYEAGEECINCSG